MSSSESANESDRRRAELIFCLLIIAGVLVAAAFMASNNIQLRFERPCYIPHFTCRPIPSPSPLQQYMNWYYAATFGTVLFLIHEVSYWYPKIGLWVGGKEVSFSKQTYWYGINLIKGPFVAVLVMWFLTNINFDLSGNETSGDVVGIKLNLNELPSVVLIGLAFMLGLYSRVTRHQLDIILKRILPAAWEEAAKAKNILGIEGRKKIHLDEIAPYTTSSGDSVVWTIQSPQNIETLQAASDEHELAAMGGQTAPTATFAGARLYVKVVKLVNASQPGRLIIKAAKDEVSEYLEVDVPEV
ncbi:MAG: hypothetical protein JNL42_02295 [Anaerolineae bacterium]|nr:hypothetical protein [Anaerolineae bacterium]